MTKIQDILNNNWFLKHFIQVSTRECSTAGVDFELCNNTVFQAHDEWLQWCANYENRIDPKLDDYHYRLMGWLCHALQNNIEIKLHYKRALMNPTTKILMSYPKEYLIISACYDIVRNIDMVIRGKGVLFYKVNDRTIWSACENLHNDSREGVNFMHILCNGDGDLPSFL